MPQEPLKGDRPPGDNKPYSLEEVSLLLHLKFSGSSWTKIHISFNNQVPPDRERSLGALRNKYRHLCREARTSQPAVESLQISETLRHEPVPMPVLPPNISNMPPHEPMPMSFAPRDISETLRHEPVSMPFLPTDISETLLREPLTIPVDEAALQSLPFTTIHPGEALLPPYGSDLSWPSQLTGRQVEGSGTSGNL